MSRESHLEIKVGVFVIAALLSLAVLIFSISDVALFQQGKKLRVIFGFASGVKKAAPVRLAGVEQGIVKDVRLFFDSIENKPKAEIQIQVQKDTQIPVDSTIVINQLGLLGEKYLEIIPGQDHQHFYRDGDTIIGKDPILQEQISQKILEVSAQLERGIDGLNTVIADEGNQRSVKLALERLSTLIDSLNRVTNNVEAGKGTVGRLFFDETLYNDLALMMADLKENPWKLLYRPKK